jgi:two-component system LytT family response regulator
MNALIVDDETKAREILGLMIEVHVPEIKEIRLAGSGKDASDIMEQFHPQLVFLDIRIPGMNGFEWLASLTERPFDVIFTTAYDQFAIQAIRYAAFDYLLKPVDPEDLRNSIDRYLHQPEGNKRSYDGLLYNLAQTDIRQYRLTIATTEGMHFLDPSDIIRCEADGNYTHFYLKSGRHIMASRPLGHFSTLLPEVQFIRCHKSHLVNTQWIETITEKRIRLKDGHEVEVSRRRMPAIKTAMSK